MAEVKNVQTASATIVAAANAPVTFTDKKGRTVELREVRGANRMQFLRMLGDNATNTAYVVYAQLAASLATVGGEAVRFPTTQAQLDALVERFDRDGFFDEVAVAYRDAFAPASDAQVETDAGN